MLCAIALSVLAAICRAPAGRRSAVETPGSGAGRARMLTRPPGDDSQLALTVDDGASVSVVTAFARFCKFQSQQIVLAHASLPTITHCYSQLIDIIQSRNLQTLTFNDVFG